MKSLKVLAFLICCIIMSGCFSSSLGVSRFTSEKIEIGMSKDEFLKICGKPFAKEMTTNRYNNKPVERLLYQESLYSSEWYVLTSAFVFEDGQLISQVVVGKEVIGEKSEKK